MMLLGGLAHIRCVATSWQVSEALIFDDNEDGLDEEVLEAEVDTEYNLTRPRKD